MFDRLWEGFHRSANQSIGQSANQSTNRTVGQPFNRTIGKSVKSPVSQIGPVSKALKD